MERPIPIAEVQAPLEAGCGRAVMAKLRTMLSKPKPAPKLRPTFSGVPQMSPERLAQAATDGPDDTDGPKPKTYLYLAYGSNLAAETFLGFRGIRPLSQVNVSVPTLELTFSISGIPYIEPCFANVDYRKVPDKPPKLPNPSLPPPKVPIDPPTMQPYSVSKWGKGLIGVVYEVTEEDYRTIIVTEGSGAGYKQVVVPCLPIPPKVGIPEKPPIPELPKPFLAYTLLMPRLPEPDLPSDPRKREWWYYRFLTGPQRELGYAQASARYLKLITDGAREHDLPDDYQRYLGSLQPYTINSWRQRFGAVITTTIMVLFFLPLMALSRWFADENGNAPNWLMGAMTAFVNAFWMLYDHILKSPFGDGERTEGGQGTSKVTQDLPKIKPTSRGCEEKAILLEDFE